MIQHIILYLLIGVISGGIFNTVIEKEVNGGNHDHEPFGYLAIPILWPLAVPIFFVYVSQKLTYYIIYSKKDKIAKVAERLKK